MSYDDDPTLGGILGPLPGRPQETTHACPVDGQILTGCCGRTVFELPHTDRLTVDPQLVTCRRLVDDAAEQQRDCP
jgi:hypothetical protein